MTMSEKELDDHFITEAVRKIEGTGAKGATAEAVFTNGALRAQFRAMLVDARSRFDPQGVNHASIERLIGECDRYAEAEPAVAMVPGKINAGGSGFQVPVLEGPKLVGEAQDVRDLMARRP